MLHLPLQRSAEGACIAACGVTKQDLGGLRLRVHKTHQSATTFLSLPLLDTYLLQGRLGARPVGVTASETYPVPDDTDTRFTSTWRAGTWPACMCCNCTSVFCKCVPCMIERHLEIFDILHTLSAGCSGHVMRC